MSPLLAIAKMPDDVIEALLKTHKDMKELGKVEENPNGPFDAESPQGNNFRNVENYLVTDLAHIAYTYLLDLAILFRAKTNIRWDRLDLISVMDYPVGGLYKDHTDWTLEDTGTGETTGRERLGFRKISFIAQLSEPDDYVGGNVNIWLDGKALILPKDKGTICAFPSFNRHGVESVIEGNRLSMVSWVLGNENWI